MTSTVEPQNRSAVLPHVKAHPMTITTSPIPEPTDSEVLIRVRAVAMNPADWAVQALGMVIKPEYYPYVNGVDVSGEVVAVGPSNTRFKPGDRVTASATAWQKGQTKYGAFQEYTIGVEPMLAKIPDRISYKEAAVLPLGFTTAAAMLFCPELMGLDWPKAGTKPNSKGQVVLVWGGSSSVGSNAILTAKAAGYIVAATASERNHVLLREMNVDYVFDYNKDNAVDDIVETLQGKGELAGIYNAIFTEPTIKACATIAAKLKGTKSVGTVLGPGMPVPGDMPDGVEILVNNNVHFGDTETGRALWVDWLAGALEDGSMKCKPNPEVVGKGIEKIQDAVDAMGKGVSGKKLVVEL
ncbi:hypothetical protein NM208_g4822 [Fusarium decemcellulare]|uniref:Uncharacterized protein n=1 Tax=Fusarium decemcellulare TaxID=57161 RepID=A0ACC1SJ55_9HYPO|nr:hypothetical protein NM208_g4822 [Fusarium decemcellulare]